MTLLIFMQAITACLHITQTPQSIRPVLELQSFPTNSDFRLNFSTTFDSTNYLPGSPFVVRLAFPLSEQMFTDHYLNYTLGSKFIQTVETARKETRKSVNLFNKMRWSDFLHEYSDSDIYLVSQMPLELRPSILLPGFLSCPPGLSLIFCAELDTPIVWLSGGSTQSVVHADSDDNIHCVLDGEKEFFLWSPDQGIETAEFGWTFNDPEKGYGSFAGDINVDCLDAEIFPGWLKIVAERAVLYPGDCLYLPMKWIHYVRSGKGRTMSFHVWFRPALGESDLKDEGLFPVSEFHFEDDRVV